MTSEYRHDGPYRRPAKGDLAYRVLKYPGWCNEEDPGGEWLGDVAMDGGESGLVLTKPYQEHSGCWWVKMLVNGCILVVDMNTIEVI